jgi:tetratricopeptide (TPR) repeat protein
MGDGFLQGYDPLAVLLIVLAIGFAATIVGVAVYRQRKRFPRWLRSMMVRRRLDMIRRDLYRMAEYVGTPYESDQAAWQQFEYGLAAMGAHQWNQALTHFRQAQANAEEAQLAPLLNQIGICYYMQGRLGDGLRELDESARLAERHQDKPCKAAALSNTGVIRSDRGELEPALSSFREALVIARESGNHAAEALFLGNIGNVLRQKGELNPAMKSLEDALAISRRIGDEEGVTSAVANIGSALRDKGDRDKALERYAEAEEKARKIGYKLGATVVLSNIGNLYREKGDTDRSLKSHEAALALAHEIGCRSVVDTELVNIGLIMVSKRQHERAVSYLAESLTFFLSEGVVDGQRQGLYGLSRCDDSLGRERMQVLMKDAGLNDETVTDVLDRIDLIRSRRPWQVGKQRNPFAPVGR